MKRRLGSMGRTLAVRLMDELSYSSFKVEKLFFHLMGEPILHPDFLSLLNYALRLKLPVSIYTNGSRLNLDTVLSIFALNPPELVISIQAPDKKTFALRKDSVSYEGYLQNLKDLILAKINSKADTKIELRLLITKKDSIFSPRFWLVDRPLDVVSGKSSIKYFLDTLSNELKDTSISLDSERILSKTSLSKAGFSIEILKNINLVGATYFSWYNFEDAKIPGFKRAFIGGCDGFRRQVAILWDGSVTSCCVDYEGRNTAGNVTNRTLNEILNNESVSRFRKKFKHCILPTPYCRICRGSRNIRVWLAKQLGSIFIYNFLA